MGIPVESSFSIEIWMSTIYTPARPRDERPWNYSLMRVQGASG
jgi:hypothetical protein